MTAYMPAPPLWCSTDDTGTRVVVNTTRGDTVRIAVTLSTTGGDPVDVTDWTWLAQIRDAADAMVAEFTVTTADPTTGQLLLELDPAQAVLLPVAELAWDLESTIPVGTVRTIVRNAILRVWPDVSRAVG